jgi:flavodoxin
MKLALIIYHSQTGTTRRMGIDIRNFCKANGIEPKFLSTSEFTNGSIENTDYLFLGCWTHGLFFFLQHPEKAWVEFAAKLPSLTNQKIVLFTTYKIATGSMFKQMRKHLKCKPENILIELKSRSGDLDKKQEQQLKALISN